MSAARHSQGGSTQDRLVRNTAANAAAQIAQMASAFVFMPLLVHEFGLAEYGVFMLAGSMSGYLGLLDFGVGASLVKFVAEKKAKQQTTELTSIISSALLFYVFVGVVACVLLVVGALLVTPLFQLTSSDAALASQILLVAAVTALITWPTSAATYVLGGLQRYDLTASVSLLATVLTAAATIAIVLTHAGPLILMVAVSAVSVLTGGLTVVIARRQLRDVQVSPRRASLATIRRIFRFSGVVFVSQICAVLIYQQTDRIVLGIFVGASAIGLYEAASRMQTLVRQLAQLSASAILPVASQLDGQGRTSSMQQLFLKGTLYADAFVTPIALTIMILAGPLLIAWLGPEYAGQTLAVVLFVSYWLLNANTTVPGAILIGSGRLPFILWYSVVSALANVALSILLVQQLGMIGVILGTVITYYVGFPVYMLFSLRILGVPVKRWLVEDVLRTYPFLLVPLAVSLLCRASGLTSSLTGVAASGLLSVGAYWAVFARWGLAPADRAILAAAVRARLRRDPRQSPEESTL